MKKVLHVLEAVFEACIGAVLPLRERIARTNNRSVADIPLSPRVHALLGTEITTLADYRERAVEDLVRSLKYDRSRHAARLGATLLGEYLREEIASHKLFSQKRVMIIPVPLHRTRERERGFNQIDLALRALPEDFLRETGAEIRRDTLIRTRPTEQQTHLPRLKRLSNVAGAFSLARDTDLSGTRIFLIDDVTTTGATLVHAATPLRRAGADLSLIALARA